MGPMDEQTKDVIIQVLRQMLADSQWREVQLQAEVIRLNAQASAEPTPEGD